MESQWPEISTFAQLKSVIVVVAQTLGLLIHPVSVDKARSRVQVLVRQMHAAARWRTAILASLRPEKRRQNGGDAKIAVHHLHGMHLQIERS